MLVYKFDVLAALKAKGYSTYKLTKDKIIGGPAIQRMRQGLPVSIDHVDLLCRLLDCQPGDLLEYVPADDQGNT